MRARRLVAALLVAVVATAPLPADGAVDQFTNVHLLVNTGDKPEERDAILRLDGSTVTIESRAGGQVKRWSAAEIKSLEYSYSKSPRWKSGTAVAIAVGVFAIPIFFMKGKKHWLTVVGENDFAVLRLDKTNYRVILPALEASTGKPVEHVPEEK